MKEAHICPKCGESDGVIEIRNIDKTIAFFCMDCDFEFKEEMEEGKDDNLQGR